MSKPTASAPLTAIICMIGSTACFSLMNIGIRLVSDDLPSTQIVLLRNIASFLVLLPFTLPHGKAFWGTQRLRGHFFRSLIGIVGMQLWFYAVTHMKLNEATALSFLSPILTTLIAMVILKERVGWRRWSAIFLGFIGVLVILQPQAGATFEPVALVVVVATFFWASAGMLVKTLAATESPLRMVMFMTVFMTFLSLPPAILVWEPLQWSHAMPLALIGFASVSAHVLMVRAFARAPVVTLMPFDFCRLLFTALFSYLVFHEASGFNTWLGGAIIVGSTAYIAHREAVLRRRATAIAPTLASEVS